MKSLARIALTASILAGYGSLVAPPFALAAQAPVSRAGDSSNSVDNALDSIAGYFIRMTLEAGTFEEGYVDAYYGEPAIRTAAEAGVRGLSQTRFKAVAIPTLLDSLPERSLTPLQARRVAMLRAQAIAADTRLRMIGGERLSFDAEAQGLFATLPVLHPLAHYDAILANLETLIPGTGALPTRVDAFNERYTIPPDRLRPVFDAAIAECRRRTAQHIALPEGENFTLEFVTGKPWSGYNYYQGNFRSLIQINTDLPIRISRAVDLGCHEGYPGHHVLNLLVEQNLVRGRGWQEYSVYPLYSPQSVLAEGSANYGIDLAFPGTEKLAFERDTLYPLAGLDPATADDYARVQAATEALSGARLTIAKLYLDGEIDRARAVELTQRYLLLSPARAEQSVGFTDRYRSYVINYGWGKDLVRAAIEAGNPDAATRWQRMEAILSEPTLPADLVAMARR